MFTYKERKVWAALFWFVYGCVFSMIRFVPQPNGRDAFLFLISLLTVGAILFSNTTRLWASLMWIAIFFTGIFALVFGMLLPGASIFGAVFDNSSVWSYYETMFPGLTEALASLIVPGFFGLFLVFAVEPVSETQQDAPDQVQ